MILGIFLAFSSIMDIWKRKVYLIPAAAAGLSGIIIHVVNRQMTWKSCGGGVVIGCVMLAAARISDEAIGYGDGAAVIVIGIWMGFYHTVEVLLTGLTMAAVFSAILLLSKRAGRKKSIPFIPFLFAAYILFRMIQK